MTGTPQIRIAAFLALTVAFSAVWFLLIVGQFGIPHSVLATGAMWSPGLAAICVRLWFQRNLDGTGWKSPPIDWLAIGLALPLTYGVLIHGLAWAAGAGPLPDEWIGQIPYGVTADNAGVALALLLTLGVVDRFFRALGEEIGWRGLLLPEMIKLVGFRKAAVASSVVWAGWHLPLIVPFLLSQTNPPPAFSLACFATTLVSAGVVISWVKIKSQSLWPCVMIHGAHNLFVLAILDAATSKQGWGAWLLGEFGAGMAIMAAIGAALVLLRTRDVDAASSYSTTAIRKPS
ncbi:MAG TPA: type II CAAX endopeptidase family protein [Hyphomonadaceae bacterium]|nr:type II CAAX endopeptidase family protein [Hyphomonadaceae bacterium]